VTGELTRAQIVGRVMLGLVALVVAVNALFYFIEQATGAPGGPVSSSYATAESGLAAYATLLQQQGRSTVQLRTPVTAGLSSSATLVVLDPENLGPRETDAMRSFVRSGGRLVAGGASPYWLEDVMDDPPTWSLDGDVSPGVLVPAPELDGVDHVRAAGTGSWSNAGASLPVLGDGDGSLLTVASIGLGRLVLFADSSPLQNALLDSNDNAALALAVAGEPDRPVVFAEAAHGYGRATGVGALPPRWRWAFAGLMLAAVVMMVARGRRLGPPEEATRALPPARREYARSLAAILERTRSPGDAAVAVQEAAHRRIVQRAGLGAGAGRAELRAAAGALGLPEGQVRALFETVASTSDLMAAGRALASLSAGRGAIAGGKKGAV